MYLSNKTEHLLKIATPLVSWTMNFLNVWLMYPVHLLGYNVKQLHAVYGQ